MESAQIELSTGARLFVARKGTGDELVVFLHAAGADHTSWYHQMEGLGDRYTCVAFDMRGHGRSAFDVEDTIVREAISVSAFAKDAIALVEKQGFRRAHVVGLGLGGVVALEVFKRRSDLVQSLTLASSWAYHPDGEMRGASPERGRTLFAAGAAPAIVDRAAQIEEATNRHVFAASWQAMFSADYRAMVPLIDVPLLLVAGSDDKLSPPEPLSMTTAEVLTIDGAGHFSNLERPAELTRVLRAHLLRARASDSQRIALGDAKPVLEPAKSIGAALSALLARRGIRCFTDVDETTAAAMAHGGWLTSGRPHAVLTDEALLLIADPQRLKWERTVSNEGELETVVDRAVAISTSDPPGYARLSLAAGVLDRPLENFSFASLPRHNAHAPSEPSSDAIERAVQLIGAAQRPLAISCNLGRYRGGVDALVQLSQRHGIPVVEESDRGFTNFPTRHPMHLGFRAAPFAKQADLVLAIEASARDALVAHGPRVIQIGVDPLQTSAGAGCPSDLALAGNPALTLRRLYAALDKSRPDRSMIDARVQAFASEHRRVIQQAQTRAIADAALPTITRAFLSYCLGEAIGDATIFINDGGADPSLVPRRLADTWFSAPLAAAVGAQLACPDATVMAVVDAATYLRSNPLAVHHAAAARKLPIVVVVLNDSSAELVKVVEACGGAGFCAQTPRELPATLRRALDVARARRRQVLLDVRA